jgi:hypothetical protein
MRLGDELILAYLSYTINLHRQGAQHNGSARCAQVGASA